MSSSERQRQFREFRPRPPKSIAFLPPQSPSCYQKKNAINLLACFFLQKFKTSNLGTIFGRETTCSESRNLLSPCPPPLLFLVFSFLFPPRFSAWKRGGGCICGGGKPWWGGSLFSLCCERSTTYGRCMEFISCKSKSRRGGKGKNRKGGRGWKEGA